MKVFLLFLLLPSILLSKAIDIVVVIPSYNNANYIKRNLESLVKQDFPNWEMIYINDCSTDQTGDLVEKFVKKHRIKDRCQIIHNTERVGAMANIYKAVHLVAPNKVVVLLDGDDELKGSKVLSRVARTYSTKPNVWITYGNYEATPKNAWSNDPCYAFPEAVMKRRTFREFTWVCYPLRTFYAKLFHHIKKEDLMWQGKFLPVVSDPGYMFPMLEMASNGHIHYEKKVLYTYHVNNPINDFRINLPLMNEVS
ncbi:MAG: glycosyltransferase family 2 protein, partial [Verrucomicrobia bacterium]|nr:glycosyltransferase family 2 protein [Verrucomicrobiota bacterium]